MKPHENQKEVLDTAFAIKDLIVWSMQELWCEVG